MKVKAKQTVTSIVDVELDDKGVLEVIEKADSRILLQVLQRHLTTAFITRIRGKQQGELVVRLEWVSSSSRHCPERGAGSYLALVEIDGDFDYHNNVGVDEFVRWLTDEERQEWATIEHFADETFKKLQF